MQATHEQPDTQPDAQPYSHFQPEKRTRRRSERPLVMLNVGLLALLAVLTFGPSGGNAASAQPREGQPREGATLPRARGNYTMLSGRLTAGGPDAVFVIDANNQEMVALRWDNGKKNFAGIGYRSLDADVRQPAPGR